MRSPSKTREFEKEYLQTDFVVKDGEVHITIRVGELNSALDELLMDRGAKAWAFITAQNPGSVTLSARENDFRQSQLRQLLDDKGYKYLHGYGQGKDGNWPPEQSFLILNVERDAALKIGRIFDQNAIVAGRIGIEPQLIWCD